MAFGSGNQSSSTTTTSAAKPPTNPPTQHQQHHHHPSSNHHHQQSSTSQSTATQQKCSVPTGSGGSLGRGTTTKPPNLPPKTHYNNTQTQDASSQGYILHHHQHHHNPNVSNQLPLQQMFFQNNPNNPTFSNNTKKPSYHHVHGGPGVGGAFSSDGVVMDERYFSGSGGSSHHHHANNNNNNHHNNHVHQHSHSHVGQNSSSSSLSQQQYNHLFGGQQSGVGGGAGAVVASSSHQLNRDLTEPERLMLEQIRSRKAELLKEIAQLQDEIDCVSKELIVKDSSVTTTQEHHAHHHHRVHHGPPPPPDLISPSSNPPLADIELDNLSEHSGGGDEHHHNTNNNNNANNTQKSYKIPSSSVLGSNNSSSSSSSLLSKEKERLKHMSLGCKKFNMDPKKGIEYLVLNGLLKKEDEMDVGLFLYRGEGLNKTAIGDYLGEKNDFNERVLRVFVGLHDFTDLILVQALRQFLWSFRLPGEAQKIDRMMECFAQRYCQNNPDIFTNTDTCYVLSFAIIMLNTSLHNPSVKDKPTVEQFISMNRGINNGGDLPRELLISLYNSIQSEPFKIPEDDGNDLMTTFFNPDKEGWLWKQGGRYKTWKRRWFILNDNCLYYFEFTTDKEPRGIIPLENVNVREIEEGSGGGGMSGKRGGKYCFELYATDGSEVIKACKTDSDGKVVEGKHSVYRMSAASVEERDSWVKALRQSISYSPLYEILRKSGNSGGRGGSSSSLRGGSGGAGSRLKGASN